MGCFPSSEEIQARLAESEPICIPPLVFLEASRAGRKREMDTGKRARDLFPAPVFLALATIKSDQMDFLERLFQRQSALGLIMRDTQIQAWDSIQEKLPASRNIVFRSIQLHGEFGITTYGLSAALGWSINCVSGRVTELCKSGLVRDSGRRGVNPSGKKAVLWVVNGVS